MRGVPQAGSQMRIQERQKGNILIVGGTSNAKPTVERVDQTIRRD